MYTPRILPIVVFAVFTIFSSVLFAEEPVEARMNQIEQDIRRLSGELAQLRMDHKMQLPSSSSMPQEATSTTPQKTAHETLAAASSAPSTETIRAEGESDPDPVARLIQQEVPPSTDLSPKPPQDQFLLPTQATDQAAYVNARDLLSKRDYLEAASQFELFLETFPQSDLRPNAAYWLGESYSAVENWPAAAKAYGKAYTCGRECMKSSHAKENQTLIQGKIPASMLKLSDILGRLGQKEQACITLETLKRDFSLHPSQVRAVENLSTSNKCQSHS